MLILIFISNFSTDISAIVGNLVRVIIKRFCPLDYCSLIILHYVLYHHCEWLIISLNIEGKSINARIPSSVYSSTIQPYASYYHISYTILTDITFHEICTEREIYRHTYFLNSLLLSFTAMQLSTTICFLLNPYR